MNRKEKISVLTLVIAFGFLSAVVFHYIQATVLGKIFPLNTFLPGPVTKPAELFGDWSCVAAGWINEKYKGIGLGFSYFPASYLLAQLFTWIKPFWFLEFIYSAVFSVFCFCWIYQQLKASSKADSIRNAVIGCLMSYPFLFTFQTGNIEGYLFISLCLFIHFFQRKQTYLSSFFLAFAISMKAVPVVFILLPVADRRYREIFLIPLFCFLLTFSPLLIFDGGIRDGISLYIHRLQQSQKMYFDLMVIGDAGNHWGHSLLTFFRLCLGGMNHLDQRLLRVWFCVALSLFFSICFLVFNEKSLWKRCTLLVCALNLLPYTSTDYKLMHIWIPLALFLKESKNSRLDIVYIILFSLLLIPKNYGYLNGEPRHSISGVINAFLLLVFLVLISYTVILKMVKNRVNG